MNLIFIFPLIVILVLSIYLGILITKLKHAKLALKLEADNASEDRMKGIIDSLKVLGMAIDQGQCEPAEGCIRVKKLIDLVPDLRFHEDLVVFHEMYNEISELSWHDAYKNLSFQDSAKEDKIRFAAEDRYSDRLNLSAKKLVKLIKSEQF